MIVTSDILAESLISPPIQIMGLNEFNLEACKIFLSSILAVNAKGIGRFSRQSVTIHR
jgi:hypothetical protein